MAAVYNGLKIVPIDCNLDNWCINENEMEKKLVEELRQSYL